MTATQHTGYHLRTQNGHAALVTTAEALAEMNAVQMDKDVKHSTKSVSISGDSASIDYRDGRKVRIRPATEQQVTTMTENGRGPAPVAWDGTELAPVKANGKTYLVSTVRRGESVRYWSERNGKTFGATRTASEASKPGTVAAAIWTAFPSVAK